MGDTLHGVFGKSTSTIILASAAYCADFMPPGSRTVLMFAIDAVVMLASSVGDVINGYWVRASGFLPVVAASVTASLCVMLYVMLVFRPYARHVRRNSEHLQTRNDVTTCSSSVYTYFAGSARTLFKRRHNGAASNTRCLLIILVSLSLVYHLGYYSSKSILTVYTLGPPLCWSSVTLGYFNAVSVCLEAVMPLLISLALMRYGPSVWLMLLGSASGASSCLLYGLAQRTAVMFVSAVTSSCRVLTSGVLRSLLLDLVDVTEQGAVMGLYGVTSEIANLLSSVVYVNIYHATYSWFPGFAFMVGAALFGVGLAILGVFVLMRRRGGSSGDRQQLLSVQDEK